MSPPATHRCTPPSVERCQPPSPGAGDSPRTVRLDQLELEALRKVRAAAMAARGRLMDVRVGDALTAYETLDRALREFDDRMAVLEGFASDNG